MSPSPAWVDRPLAKALGPRSRGVVAQLAQLDVLTVGDLLRHFPRRYVTPGELTDLRSLVEGEVVTIVARVASVEARPMRARPGFVVKVVVTDGRDHLQLAFFAAKPHVAEYFQRSLHAGQHAMFSGKVDRYNRQLQLSHPSFELLEEEPDEQEARVRASRLVPVYPATMKLASARIVQLVRPILDTLSSDDVPDPVPRELLTARGLPGLADALLLIHRPTDREQYRRARKRFRFEEAFVLQVALARRRATAAALPATPRSASDGGLLAEFDARLPFELTDGQRDVGEQIAAELAAEHPMHRLLQGEVGSGKTVVALRAMLTVVDAGGQAALLAPTEVLAQQHYRSITQMLGKLGAGGMLGGAESATRVALLTGSQPAPARRQALLDAASGDAGIVIGTHALLQEKVEFFDLGLVVVDEQHRFGVEQRDALRAKSLRTPHLLVMTATPIPRTVAMTVFGDLEASTLTELPGGPRAITTHVVPAGNERWMQRTWARLREEVDDGHQGFVVCPRIGDPQADPEDVEVEGRRPAISAVEVHERLSAEPAMDGVRLGILHGRQPADEKEATMRAFADGLIDVLVATTVVEVGIDVPNATGMVVMDADWFGVSQLHQLRGRIGRGHHPGICLLVSEADPESATGERLRAVASTLDGFELSQVDLEARREGDVLGAAQSGWRSSLKLLRVLRDADVIADARLEAVALVEADADLAGHPVLADAIARLLDPEREVYLERG